MARKGRMAGMETQSYTGVHQLALQRRGMNKGGRAYDSKIDFDGTGDPEWPSIPCLVVALAESHIDVVDLHDAGDANNEAETEERADGDALFARQLKTHDQRNGKQQDSEIEEDGNDAE